ncbi:MAG: PilW family protein [Pseudomonadota bacterium]
MPAPRQRQQGFTLVELMIAATIGLLILAGMTTMFVNNTKAQAEVEKSNRQVENGRFAISLLANDVRNAAYYGEFDPTVLGLPATLPDPCSVAISDIKAALPIHVQGYDNASALGCLSDVREGTDIIVVRHASTCTTDQADCEVNSAGAPYIQASLCGNLFELGSGSTADFYALDATTATLDRHLRDCGSAAGSGTLAKFRYLEIHIYFIANNDVQGDGKPTLKRAEVVNRGGTLSVTIVPLSEGVENLQLEYGLDTNADGSTDVYTANPTTYAGCALPACDVANWNAVVSVKINVLARSTETTPDYTDSKAYVLGNRADGAPNLVAAANDHYKRHLFQGTVPLPNPSGRRTP